jgi:hypothetical protein
MPRFPTRVTTVDLDRPHICIISTGLAQMHFHPRSLLLANKEVIAQLEIEIEDIRQGVSEIEGVIVAVIDQSQLKVIKEMARSWDELLPTILEYLSLRLRAQLSVFTISAPDRRLVFWKNVASPLIKIFDVPTDPADDLSYRQALRHLASRPTDD